MVGIRVRQTTLVSADTRQYRLVSVSTDIQFSIATDTSSHVVRWLISRP